MKTIRFLIYVNLLVFALNLYAQYQLEGVVRTVCLNSEPVVDALVELINIDDTTQVLSTKTDVKGFYFLEISTSGIDAGVVHKPDAIQLYQNYPNPFNPATVISYALPNAAHVRIDIYNVLGQRIRTLFDGYQSENFASVNWDGTTDNGQGVAAGVYIYSLVSKDVRINKKMLLLDGHSGQSGTPGTSWDAANMPEALHKIQSSNYILRISGDSLSTVTDTLAVTSNMTQDVSIYRTMTDQDGNIYKIVKIGDQWWMAENLKTTKYRNGDDIDYVTDNDSWTSLTTGAYCYYENDPDNAADYGALYNWYAVSDPRNIAPSGWHVPTDEEWKELEIYLGMSQTEADNINWRGTIEGDFLKDTVLIYWYDLNPGATNASGFTARPGGFRDNDIGNYQSIGYYSHYWTTSTDNQDLVNIRTLSFYDSKIKRGYTKKKYGISVRLVQDK